MAVRDENAATRWANARDEDAMAMMMAARDENAATRWLIARDENAAATNGCARCEHGEQEQERERGQSMVTIRR